MPERRVTAAAERPRGPAGVIFAADQLIAQSRWDAAIELLIPLSQSSWESGDLRTYVPVALRIGRARSRLEHHEAAAAILKAALAAAQQLGDAVLAADVLQQLGVAHYRAGDVSVAREFLDEALRIVDDLDLKDRRGALLIELGNQSYGTQDYATAEVRYSGSLEQFLTLENRLRALCNLALIRVETGRFKEAVAPAEEAARLAESEQALPHLYSAALALLGRAQVGCGEVDAGMRLIDGAVERDRTRNDRLRLTNSLLFRGAALEQIERFPESGAAFLDAYTLSMDRASPTDAAHAAIGLAKVLEKQRKLAEAREWATKAIEAGERSESAGWVRMAKEMLTRIPVPP